MADQSKTHGGSGGLLQAGGLELCRNDRQELSTGMMTKQGMEVGRIRTGSGLGWTAVGS